jgi:hypothetical protein
MGSYNIFLNNIPELLLRNQILNFRCKNKNMKTPKVKLTILNGEFAIHRLPAKGEIPSNIYESDFFTISKTDDEVSIVCDSTIDIKSEKSEGGWSCFKVRGPLDFSSTGILAKISSCLAKSHISMFAISTYDTDYILVSTEKMEQAKSSLIESGYVIEK